MFGCSFLPRDVFGDGLNLGLHAFVCIANEIACGAWLGKALRTVNMRRKTIFFSGLALLGTLTLAGQGLAQWGSKADMYSEDGVQVGVDSRVFSVLAMLNQHGFDADKYLGQEPLKKPQFGEARSRIRGLMRRMGPVQKRFGGFIAKHPQPFSWYVAQALEAGKSPGFETTVSDKKEVRAIASSIHDWFHEGGLWIFDIAVKMGKTEQAALIEAINTITATVQHTVVMGETEDALLEEELNPLGRVVVVLAPMAPHEWLERVDTADVSYVVTGPWKSEDHVQTVANAVAVAFARRSLAVLSTRNPKSWPPSKK